MNNIHAIIPKSVLFTDIFINRNIQEIVCFARTNKNHYTEFMQSCKGLWSRSVDSSSLGPMEPLFRLADGFQELFFARTLFEKYESLLFDTYKAFGPFEFVGRGLFTVNPYESPKASIKSASYLSLEKNLQDCLKKLEKLKYDVWKVKVILVLNVLAGSLDLGLLFFPASCIYPLGPSGSLVPFALFFMIPCIFVYRAGNHSDMTFRKLLMPFFGQEQKQGTPDFLYAVSAIFSYMLFFILIVFINNNRSLI